MKPLNLDNSPCSPIASNCVIWAGEDIPCINLCKGDTISDVTFKLATELCTILDYLKVSGYDLSCFNLASCGPNNFQELIQFLIDRICALENIDPATVTTTTTTTDTTRSALVTDYLMLAAPCFGGGTVSLVSYVQQIANRICDLITEISVINASISSLQTQINTVAADVAAIVIPPSPSPIILTCPVGTLIPPNSYSVDVLLDEFINIVWCSFYSTTGSTSDLLNAIGAQVPCVSTTSGTMADRITNPAQTMGAAYAGFTNGATLAESIENLWIALCDLRNIELMQYNVTASNDITVTTTVVGTLTTFDIGRAPILNYYAEALTPIQLSSDPGYVDSTYFQPTGYTGLSYTNTSGVSKDFFVRVSYDSDFFVTAPNEAEIRNIVDGGLFKNGVVQLYSSAGETRLVGSMVDSGGNPVNLTSAETLQTVPSTNDTEFQFLTARLPRNVSFFKKVTLANGESVELKFRSKGTPPSLVGYLLQAQFYIEEIR
jgi:hypothetical protein